MSKVEILEKEIKELSSEERARLALLLIESLESEDQGDIEAAWIAEIEARLDAYDRGEVATIPAEDVFAEAHQLMACSSYRYGVKN